MIVHSVMLKGFLLSTTQPLRFGAQAVGNDKVITIFRELRSSSKRKEFSPEDIALVKIQYSSGEVVGLDADSPPNTYRKNHVSNATASAESYCTC